MAHITARKEYRCTRDCYEPGTPGAAPAGRQGHYKLAWSMEEAVTLIAAEFPDEDRFTIQAWNAGRVGAPDCQAHMDAHGHAHGHHENQVAYFYRVTRYGADDPRVMTVMFTGFGPASAERGDF